MQETINIHVLNREGYGFLEEHIPLKNERGHISGRLLTGNKKRYHLIDMLQCQDLHLLLCVFLFHLI